MYKRWFVRLTVAIVGLFAQSESSDSVVKARQMLTSSFFQNYGTSWIAGPEGYHYQFHLTQQSWNMAREYCLALASDLVVIKSLQQINWLISHYPPSNSIMPERTVQIGLVLADKESSAEKEWKWVDNTPLNATYLEWEIVLINITKNFLDPTERGRCSLLSIDNRVLKSIPCDQTSDFNYTNRFICQRSDEKHQELLIEENLYSITPFSVLTSAPTPVIIHERKNNPFYELFVQLISKLRNDTEAKPEPRTVQLQGVKTQITSVKGKAKDLSPISGKKDVTDENKEDHLPKVQKIITKETLTTVDPCLEGFEDINFVIEKKEKEKQKVVKNIGASENKPELRAKNLTAKENSAVCKENNENKKNEIYPSKQNFQQSSVCGENGTAQESPQTWYEQFGDIFRNLNLFLKQEKSSVLRALLDNNDTNKTLVQRLKEVLHAKNNTEPNKHDVSEKIVMENGVEDQQQIDTSIQEVHDISNTLTREIADDINGVFLYKKNTATALQKVEGRPAITDRAYGTTKPGTTKTYGKKELAERSAVNEDKIYELLGEKLRSILTERPRNLANLDDNATNESSETSKKITSNRKEQQINRNEASVKYDVANEQKPGPLLSADQTNMENATGVPYTFMNNTQQTTKKWAESSNETGTSPELNNIILLEERKRDRNKTNIKIDIEQAISNMKQDLENANEEIKRFSSHSR